MKLGLLGFNDKVQMLSLNQRLQRHEVLTANVANAETPGYRAVGYDFEKQLQEVSQLNEDLGLSVSNKRHLRSSHATANGGMRPEIYIRPTESIPEDGNTVDMDQEMADIARNQIGYRSTIELLNKKIGLLRYAISQGGRS